MVLIFILLHRAAQIATGAPEMQPAKTQAQPEAPDPVLHQAADGAGEEVSAEAVLVDSRAGRVLVQPEADGDPGQDLVPEPAGQVEAAAGVRAGAPPDRLLAPPGPDALRADPPLPAAAAPLQGIIPPSLIPGILAGRGLPF